MVANRPKVQISNMDLDRLISGLEVNVVSLAECVVSPGWRLAFRGGDKPALHYNLSGLGKMVVGNFPAIPLLPHTLVLIPAMIPFRIEAGKNEGVALRQIEARQPSESPDEVARYIAGNSDPEIILICGYISTVYGKSLDIFDTLASPIVEQFDEKDRLDHSLKSALAELVAQEVGMGAMTGSLMKQVLVRLLRRSLSSADLWSERFPILGDPQIARAFADMVAEPGASHSVKSLSNTAGLSRSGFMQRFTNAVGLSPLAVLRQLRMRRAASLLEANIWSLEQIANAVGYTSQRSFARAFRAVYGTDPSEYRNSSRKISSDPSGKLGNLKGKGGNS
jgi:AraC family transcriptional activator of mtrCDE